MVNFKRLVSSVHVNLYMGEKGDEEGGGAERDSPQVVKKTVKQTHTVGKNYLYEPAICLCVTCIYVVQPVSSIHDKYRRLVMKIKINI